MNNEKPNGEAARKPWVLPQLDEISIETTEAGSDVGGDGGLFDS
jgi:hypothetical protein